MAVKKTKIPLPVITSLAACALALAVWGVKWASSALLGNYSIALYGRVVDTSGAPIGGMSVDLEVLRYTSPHLLFSGNEEVRTTRVRSDRWGNFELTGERGVSVRIGRFRMDERMWDAAAPPGSPARELLAFHYGDPADRARAPDKPGKRITYTVRPAQR